MISEKVGTKGLAVKTFTKELTRLLITRPSDQTSPSIPKLTINTANAGNSRTKK